jgi:hypothetical protein
MASARANACYLTRILKSKNRENWRVTAKGLPALGIGIVFAVIVSVAGLYRIWKLL